MHKINHEELNRLNNDVWSLINESFKRKNWALMQDSISKLYTLQKKYLETLNFLDAENASLKNFLAETQKTLDGYERDWLMKIAKDNNLNDEVKERIRKTFRP